MTPAGAVSPRESLASWPLLLLGSGAAGLWLLHWGVGGHALLGHGPVQLGLRIAAVLATGLFGVIAGGRAVLGLVLSASLGFEPTCLQRSIAFGLCIFIDSAS